MYLNLSEHLIGVHWLSLASIDFHWLQLASTHLLVLQTLEKFSRSGCAKRAKLVTFFNLRAENCTGVYVAYKCEIMDWRDFFLLHCISISLSFD